MFEDCDVTKLVKAFRDVAPGPYKRFSQHSTAPSSCKVELLLSIACSVNKMCQYILEVQTQVLRFLYDGRLS